MPTIDLKLGRIIIDPPHGVFENNEPEEPPSPRNHLELGDE
ncbi:hypothetical protein N8935_06590 [Amylibacter sp.]|nr:hypothetical protein [Amylibacter sp.]